MDKGPHPDSAARFRHGACDTLSREVEAMLPDTGECCLSAPLFEGIATGSDPQP